MGKSRSGLPERLFLFGAIMQQRNFQPLAYGLREAARLCAVSARTLLREMEEGRLRGVHVRNRVLCRHADLEAWLAGRAGMQKQANAQPVVSRDKPDEN
jgi:excisionase family DNA binding protein